jgi:hypothetical protein
MVWKTRSVLGSISPTLYARLFRTKVSRETFLYLDLRFVLFLAQKYNVGEIDSKSLDAGAIIYRTFAHFELLRGPHSHVGGPHTTLKMSFCDPCLKHCGIRTNMSLDGSGLTLLKQIEGTSNRPFFFKKANFTSNYI